MDISSILTMSIVIILLLMILVFSMELLIPIQLKFEMNGLCRGYIYKIESNGELTDNEVSEFKSSLKELGLMAPIVDIDREGNKYGDKVDVHIECMYVQNKLISIFTRAEEELVFKYDRSFFIRTITN